MIGDPIWPFNEHKHFDNEQNTEHTSSKIYEENGYGIGLDTLIIS
jgi:hypothetical protein